MQHLEVSGAVRPLKSSLGVKRLKNEERYTSAPIWDFVACSWVKLTFTFTFLNTLIKIAHSV